MKRDIMLVMFLVVSAAFIMLTLHYFPHEGWLDTGFIIATYLLPWFAFNVLSDMDEKNTGVLVLIFLLVSFSILVYMREHMAMETLNYLLVLKRTVVVIVVMSIGFLISKPIAKQFLNGNQILFVLFALAGPIGFLVARIFCEPYNGAYNWIAGVVMPSELSKLSLVAIIPLVLGRDHEKISTEKRNVLLVYFVTFGLTAIWASEFGTLLVILIFLILISLVDKSLNRYFLPGILCGAVVSGLAYLFSEKVRTRVGLFIEPWEAIMRGEEQSVINERILTGAQFSGYWGSEFKFSLYELPPNMSSDYIISTIMLDLGLIIVVALLVVNIGIFAFFSSIKVDGFMEKRVLNGITIVLLTSFLISYAGNLLSFPLTGLSLPYITSVSTLQPNLVFMFMAGLACSMRSREEGTKVYG